MVAQQGTVEDNEKHNHGMPGFGVRRQSAYGGRFG
jgi:hypothetical protein